MRAKKLSWCLVTVLSVLACSSSDNDDGMNTYKACQVRKGIIAKRYISNNAMKVTMLCDQILSGDRSSITEYDAVIGPVPEA